MVTRLCAVLLMLVPISAAALCSAPLRVLVSHWPPYIQVQPAAGDTDISGLDVRIVDALIRDIGCQAAWVQLPPDRGQAALRKGEIDILLAASRIPEREGYAFFVGPYRHETIAIAGRLDALPMAGLDDIVTGALQMAVPRHGWYGHDYQRMRETLLAEGLLSVMSSYRSGLAMLKARRVDLVMGDLYALEAAARDVEMVLSRPVITLNEAPVHLMVSRASVDPRVAQAMDARLAQWHDNGVLERLRWGYLP